MFELKMRTSGAAFCDENGNEDEYYKAKEVARMLAEIADKIDPTWNGDAYSSGSIMDINGNKIGEWRLS